MENRYGGANRNSSSNVGSETPSFQATRPSTPRSDSAKARRSLPRMANPTSVKGMSDASSDDDEEETYCSNGLRVHTAPEVTFSRRVAEQARRFESMSPKRNASEIAASHDWKKLPLSRLLQRSDQDENQPVSSRSEGQANSFRSDGRGAVPLRASPRQNVASSSSQDWRKLNFAKLSARSEQSEERRPKSGRSDGRPLSARSWQGWNPGGAIAYTQHVSRQGNGVSPRAGASEGAQGSPRYTHATVRQLYETLMAENERMRGELGEAVAQNGALKTTLSLLETEIAALRSTPTPPPSAPTPQRTPPSASSSRTPPSRWSASRAEREDDAALSRGLLQVTREKQAMQCELEELRVELARERMRRRRLEEHARGLASPKDTALHPNRTHHSSTGTAPAAKLASEAKRQAGVSPPGGRGQPEGSAEGRSRASPAQSVLSWTGLRLASFGF